MEERGNFMVEKKKIIPDFKDEDQEREFWATHSPLDYFDDKGFKRASFPKLKPSVKSISIRLPEDMLAELKTLANKKDVPYQSLAKIYIARQISLERGSLQMASQKKVRKVDAQHKREKVRS
jgi:predicted DNA binding CopG/RHH family protein